jgi:hypothetical protein
MGFRSNKKNSILLSNQERNKVAAYLRRWLTSEDVRVIAEQTKKNYDYLMIVKRSGKGSWDIINKMIEAAERNEKSVSAVLRKIKASGSAA